MKKILLSLLILLLLPFLAVAEDVYQQPEEFIQQSFAGINYTTKTLNIDYSIRKQAGKILRHKYRPRQINYWRYKNKTVWILDEIGKVKPITTGIIVNDGKIETLKVLIYRESHGWEVKYPSFTDQFNEAMLKDNNKLDRHIDGISGATLSVKALTRLGQLALLFHKQVMSDV